MFEITISTDKSRMKDVLFIINRIRSQVKALKAIMVCEEIDKRSKLTIAVVEEKKDFLISIIFDAIAESIVRSYKEEYLYSKLYDKIADKVVLSAFVKALTMFDKTSDKEFVKQKLSISEEILMDSFYKFRLWDLEKRWSEIASLVSESSSYLLMSGTFMELMRFLIMTNECECGEISLKVQNGHICAKNNEGMDVFSFKYVKNDDKSLINVISELISLAPEKIIVDGEYIDENLKKYLTGLFEGRVSVLNR